MGEILRHQRLATRGRSSARRRTTVTPRETDRGWTFIDAVDRPDHRHAGQPPAAARELTTVLIE